jgi:hypothetical protein
MRFRIFAMLVAVYACASFAYAGVIESADLADDGDGVITCSLYDLIPVPPEDPLVLEYELGIDGVHHLFDTGHILGDIVVPTNDDPKLTLLHDIDNDTLLTWTDYHAEVTMSKEFSFDNVSVANTGWTYQITQPTLQSGNWIGTIDYYAGDTVAPGYTLSFGYRMTFSGSASFCEALTPTVPEPGTLALLACGLFGLLIVRRRFSK